MLVSTSSSLWLLLFIELTAVVWAGMCKCSRENNQRNTLTLAHTITPLWEVNVNTRHSIQSREFYNVVHGWRYKRAVHTQSPIDTVTYTSTCKRTLANEKGTAMVTATMTTRKEKYAHKRTNQKKSPNGFRFFRYCLHFGDLFPSSLFSAAF